MVDPGLLLAYPLLLIAAFFALFGILWAIGYPLMFLWAALFSGRNLDKRIVELTEREAASLSEFGRDPLSTLRGEHRSGAAESGLVYASVVFGPSHWHLLITALGNLVGGRIDILHKVVAAARAEAQQRLREQALADGWEEVLNVRLDTAEMTPASRQKGVRAVEVFAYGTGVRYG
jgi:uncharacterized protein YbjQ (UPF0145 family)